MATTRSKQVLTKDPVQKVEGEFVFFGQTNEDDTGWKYHAGHYMRMSLFEDMGSPETITVSVEHGDLLNQPSLAENLFDLTFGRALELLKEGDRIARDNWNGKGQYLELQVPDELSKMSLPYIYITTALGTRVPWVASQSDLLAGDWFVVS